MKIFLVYLGINSPQNTGYNYGLSYIGAVLKKAGFNVKYYTLLNEQDCNNMFSDIENESPFLIGFSVTSSQFIYLKEIVGLIKEFSESFIVCGGPHPTLVPDSISDIPGVNAYIIGEGEYSLLELANALNNNKDYKQIKNIWINKNGRIIKNEIRPLQENLDTLPFPDIESIKPVEMRGTNSSDYHIRFNFSRGCPFDCSYCCNKAISQVYPNPQKYFRQRSPDSAIKEIELAEKKYHFNYIVFDDDCFTLNKKWFREFISLYKLQFKYPFRCNIRVGTADDEVMQLLKEAGATNIGVGIEHGNEKFRINVLKKNITNKQIEETFALIRKYNISHYDFIMVGIPYETKALFRDTVRLCRKVNARGSASIFYPYPGTELGKMCKENNWLPDKEVYREREEATISYPEFTKEEIQAAARAFPYLLANKSIPLYIPFEIVPHWFQLQVALKSIKQYYLKKLKFYSPAKQYAK